MTRKSTTDFEKIAKFPVAEARQLVLRATARTPASAELAAAIKRLNATLAALADVIEEVGDGPNYRRHDALVDLWAVRRMCLPNG